MKKQTLTYEEVLVIDKVIDEAKLVDFEFRETETGRQYFWDGEFQGEKLSVMDGLQFICDSACYGFDWAFEFGLSEKEIDIWNAMIDRLGFSSDYKAEPYKEREVLGVRESKRFGKKFVKESDEPRIEDIYSALKEEYDGKLFSDNFLKVKVDRMGSSCVKVSLDMEKPKDYDGKNPDDVDWWMDKVDSATLLYGEVVGFLVDRFGEEFDFDEIGVDDEYVNSSNYKGAFKIVQEQEADDAFPTITVCER